MNRRRLFGRQSPDHGKGEVGAVFKIDDVPSPFSPDALAAEIVEELEASRGLFDELAAVHLIKVSAE